jgi:hypothetical protein
MLVSNLHVTLLQLTVPVPAIRLAQVTVSAKLGSHCSVVLRSITPLPQVVLAPEPLEPLTVSSNVLAPFAQAPKANAIPMAKKRSKLWLFAIIAVLRSSSS